MDEPESKAEQPEKQRRFSQEQYEMLKRCSDKKDMTEWNEWRKENPNKDVCLDGANLQGFYLRNANFIHARVSYSGEGRDIDYSGKIYLREANLKDVDAEKAWFGNAHLEKTYWWYSNARDIDFHGAHLEEAHLGVSKLDGCRFSDAHLLNATLTPSSLCAANFLKSDLRGCSIRSSVVDGSTRFWECIINRYSKNDSFTDLTGVPLNNVIIDPATKQLLEYNIRRMNWEKWYKDENVPIKKGKRIFSNDTLRKWTNRFLKCLIKNFWRISDYGLSTWQIIKTFFQWALIFAAVYLTWGLIDYHLLGLKDNPGIASNLFVLEGEQETISPYLVPFRSVYFSIVTMTTLGFGDIYANAHSFIRGLFGHTFLALQVILGYVLLGALITRFAVLFTAGGPAGRFADDK